MLVGVLSDTHSLLRPEVLAAFRAAPGGIDHILHAGDVGDPAILDALAAIAPVTAVRGNVDHGGRGGDLPATETITLGGHTLYMLHNLEELDLDPAAAGFSAAIFGHSHQPLIDWRVAADGHRVLYFNPGSCGPRRFSLPVSLGFIGIVGDELRPQVIDLK
jgi:putative phosphoesterase